MLGPIPHLLETPEGDPHPPGKVGDYLLERKGHGYRSYAGGNGQMAFFLSYDQGDEQESGQVASEIHQPAHAMASLGLLDAMGNRPMRVRCGSTDRQVDLETTKGAYSIPRKRPAFKLAHWPQPG